MTVKKKIVQSEDIPEFIHRDVYEYKKKHAINDWDRLEVVVTAKEVQYNYVVGERTPFVNVEDYDLMSKIKTKFTFIMNEKKGIQQFISDGKLPKVDRIIIEDTTQ